MTETDRELGRLEATTANLESAMAEVRQDIDGIKSDVHEIKVMMAQMQGQITELSRASANDSRLPMFGFILLALTAYALNKQLLSEWGAIAVVFVAAVVMQRESINKLAKTIFRVKDTEPDADAGTAGTRP